jgi:hypothetical protein
MARSAQGVLVLCLLAPPAALAQPSSASVKKPPARADAVGEVLKSRALVAAYNPVLLGYLLDEGKPRLGPERHREAVDQLVTRFKMEIDVRPGEQAAASVATLVGMLAPGTVGQGVAEGAGSVWAQWVSAAHLLTRAGYKDVTIPFFEKCIETYPYDSLRESCAVGLTNADPVKAFDVLMGLAQKGIKGNGDLARIALRLLGSLAGAKNCPPAKRDAAVEELIKRTEGLLNNVFYVAAIDGLVLSQDRRAIEPMRKMTKGLGRNADVERAAKRGLLIGFKDDSVVPQLEKDTKGGFGKDDENRFFAGALLVEAGHDSGFAWAQERLTKKKGGLSKLKGGGDGDELADIVTVLVRKGGPKAVAVLQAALPVRKPDEWLTAHVAVGLLELGDTTGIEISRQALGNGKWLRTRLRAAEALARQGDLSGVPVLKALTEDTGLWKKAGDLALGRFRDPEEVKSVVAASLGRIDKPEAAEVLAGLLDDKSDEVRTAAAYALARMKDKSALAGLAKGLLVDFGKDGSRARTPEVQAHLLRMALLHFPKTPRTSEIAKLASQSEIVSVRFLALVAGA